MRIVRKENDPKIHMTLVEYMYEERYLDMFLRVYRWESRNGEISYGWEISKEYATVTLRERWSISGEKTFGAAYLIALEELAKRIDKNFM